MVVIQNPEKGETSYPPEWLSKVTKEQNQSEETIIECNNTEEIETTELIWLSERAEVDPDSNSWITLNNNTYPSNLSSDKPMAGDFVQIISGTAKGLSGKIQVATNKGGIVVTEQGNRWVLWSDCQVTEKLLIN